MRNLQEAERDAVLKYDRPADGRSDERSFPVRTGSGSSRLNTVLQFSKMIRRRQRPCPSWWEASPSSNEVHRDAGRAT